MALQKIRLGDNEDGTPHYFYRQTDPSVPVIVTGPISGTVTLPDGTVYDVTDAVIEVAPGHELHVSDAIGARHVAEGHPRSDSFVHVPSSLTHDADGSPSPEFAEAVHSLAPAGKDSSPQAVIDHLAKKKG